MNIVRLDDLCYCLQVLEYVCEKETYLTPAAKNMMTLKGVKQNKKLF